MAQLLFFLNKRNLNGINASEPLKSALAQGSLESNKSQQPLY